MDDMTTLVLMIQFFFSVVIGLYFFSQLRTQQMNRNALNKDSTKELERLRKLRQVQLTQPLSEKTRPAQLSDIIGQQDGVKALRAAICSPNPQHVLIYGPAGVGKTAAARVILEEAKKMEFSPFNETSKFIETDATTMRFDERNIADPLIGSVHDPIYQGAGAYGAAGIPQPKEGAVTRAHGGVLFIDEIGELHPIQMNRLLKVLEDRKVMLESAYYSEEDKNIPRHIHDIFKNGLPADFRLIGATTRSPEEIPPAIRSRCVEIFFHPLSGEDLIKIAQGAIRKVGYEVEDGVCDLISRYAQNGRDCVNIVQRAASVMQLEYRSRILVKDVQWVLESGKYMPRYFKKLKAGKRLGVVNGLAVSGSSGFVMDIEVTASENVQGIGNITVTGIVETEEINGGNQKLYRKGTAKASIDNALTYLKRRYGVNWKDYDIHINFPGGMPVDGPSAGIAIFSGLYGAIFGIEADALTAMTGEISIRGGVLPVGGVAAKVEAAKTAGAKRVIIPKANYQEFFDDGGIEIIPAERVEEVIEALYGVQSEAGAIVSIPARGTVASASGTEL